MSQSNGIVNAPAIYRAVWSALDRAAWPKIADYAAKIASDPAAPEPVRLACSLALFHVRKRAESVQQLMILSVFLRRRGLSGHASPPPEAEAQQWRRLAQLWRKARGKDADPLACLGEAHALSRLQLFAEAEAVLAPVPNPDRLLATELGWAALNKGDWDTAWARLQPLAMPGTDPINQLARQGAAVALAASHRLDEAGRVLQAELNDPGTLVALVLLAADIALERLELTEAVRALRALAQRMPDSPAPAARLIETMIQNCAFAEAESLIGDAEQRFPQEPIFAYLHGFVAEVREDTREAERRYQTAFQRFPNAAVTVIGLARSLTSLGRFDECETLVRDALPRVGEHPLLLQALAQLHVNRGRYAEAEALLQRGLAIDPASRDLRAGANWLKTLAGLRTIGEGETQALSEGIGAGAPPRPTDASAAMLAQVESLGDNCELGMAQRMFAVEPLGLLRWAATRPAQIVAALENRLDGVGDPGNLFVFNRVNGEYNVGDTRYGMIMHTETYAGQMARDAFLRQQSVRARFLKDKLLSDIEAGEKLFIYKSQAMSAQDAADFSHYLDETGGVPVDASDAMTDEQAFALHRALRAIGPKADLMVVRRADADHPHGSVHQAGDGLLFGYLERFGLIVRALSGLSVPGWLQLIEQGLALRARG